MSAETPPPSILTRAFHSLAWTAGATWAQLILSLISFAVVTTRLTPIEVGIYGAGVLVAGFVSNLFGGPFSDSLQQRAQLDDDHAHSSFLIGLGASLAIAGAIALAAGPAAALFGAPGGGDVMAALCLLIPLNAASAVPGAFLARRMKFDDIARAGTLSGAIASVAGIVAIFSGLGVWSLVISELGRQVVRLTTLLILSRYRPGWPGRFRAFGELARFNLGTLGTYVLGYGDRLAPRALVGAILGTASLGYYVMAERLLELLGQLALAPLGAVTMSSVARLQHDRPALQRLIRSLYTASTLFGYPVFLGAIVVVPPLVELAGPRWAPATLAAQVLLLVGLRTTTGVFNISILRGVGQSAAPLLLLGLGLILQLILVPVGALMFGVTGAAIAVLIRTYATWPVGCFLVGKATGVPFKDQLLAGGAALMAAFVMAGAAFGCLQALANEPPLTRLALAIPVGVAAYAVALWVFSPKLRRLSAAALKTLRTEGPRPAARVLTSELGLAE